jgi:hypothetical protein
LGLFVGHFDLEDEVYILQHRLIKSHCDPIDQNQPKKFEKSHKTTFLPSYDEIYILQIFVQFPEGFWQF